MAHVSFIHGIANKPPREQLLRDWLGALASHGGLDLAAAGVTVEMVYWADVLYPSPLAESELEAVADGGETPPEAATAPAPATGSTEEASAVAGLAAKFGAVDALAAAADAGSMELERIPLPGFVTRRLMESYLRDVHHYLFNVRFSPRRGETLAVRDEVRARTVRLLESGSRQPGPHVVVGHSLGSVIAYDCLKQVNGCPSIDGLLTIGSPLGLDEVQDQLRPGWTRADGFPGQTLRGRWVNVFDRLDPVAGFDPELANDFQRSGRDSVQDILEPNFGRWRHDLAKYFRGERLRAELASLLGL